MGYFADIAYQQAHPLVGLQYLNSLVVCCLFEALPVHFDDLITHLSTGAFRIRAQVELASGIIETNGAVSR